MEVLMQVLMQFYGFLFFCCICENLIVFIWNYVHLNESSSFVVLSRSIILESCWTKYFAETF